MSNSLRTRTAPPTEVVNIVKNRNKGKLPPGEKALIASPGTWFVWFGIAAFFILLFGIVLSVLVDSLGKPWFNTWLPENFTLGWYQESWERFNLTHIIGVTLLVAVSVIVISVVIGVPASYVLARSNFPGKKLVMLLFLLPILIPPITFGIPLATVMYNMGLGRTVLAVILVNLVPSVPFVIITMTPFIEQINPAIENAAKMCGANMYRVFTKVLAPLLIPGILAASILVLVRTVGMFDLTFLVSGPTSDTLVVAIYRAMTSAGGGESRQLISSMGVIYTALMLLILIIALRFINPTQLVAQVKDSRED
ncbi:ABC transporter permease subunit [Cryobacterium glaciale]|uniref:ABC transporter permease subunit n=1 Tax=Cryobacterium glaciale TaxID=1259145 RepID=A0A4V3I7F8_9MICO|nr:ABC transporter permease subunit [Cryobacterium glaciale]TFB68205.1 ABC transporter permease subunit [Cryobacterium glaciale]